MIRDRSSLVLYTAATCNLNCRYCYIDKNKALVEIDNILDESFKGDYYEKFIHEMFPNSSQLREIQTWGGEPFLRMDRLHNTLRRIIPSYPNLSDFFSSTNMAFGEWTDQFFGLMNVFGNFPQRQFNYCLQISLDGPEEFTDDTRGKGTTQKLTTVFHKMLSMIGDNLPPNVNLTLQFKPTLDTYTLRKLDSKEAVLKYYAIFDSMAGEIRALGFDNVSFSPTVPNLACPCVATQDDGVFFTKLCKITRELETTKPFKHIEVLTPFAFGWKGDIRLSLGHPNYTCGTGYTHLGLLPNDLVSTCHNGFVDVISDYKRLVTANNGKTTIDAKLFMSQQQYNSRLIYHKDEYPKFEDQMICFNCGGTTARVATIATQIMLLAHASQILPIYKDHTEAMKASIFYQSHTSFCIRDNHSSTGSVTTVHNGMLKLLFNGAHQLLERDGDVNWVN